MCEGEPTSHQNELCEASNDTDQCQVEEQPPQLHPPQECIEQIHACSRTKTSRASITPSTRHSALGLPYLHVAYPLG